MMRSYLKVLFNGCLCNIVIIFAIFYIIFLRDDFIFYFFLDVKN